MVLLVLLRQLNPRSLTYTGKKLTDFRFADASLNVSDEYRPNERKCYLHCVYIFFLKNYASLDLNEGFSSEFGELPFYRISGIVETERDNDAETDTDRETKTETKTKTETEKKQKDRETD